MTGSIQLNLSTKSLKRYWSSSFGCSHLKVDHPISQPDCFSLFRLFQYIYQGILEFFSPTFSVLLQLTPSSTEATIPLAKLFSSSSSSKSNGSCASNQDESFLKSWLSCSIQLMEISTCCSLLWEPYPYHHNGLFSLLLILEILLPAGRSIAVLSEQYETSCLFYVILSFLCNIICYLISVFMFSLVTLSGATTFTYLQ